jgi:hypothetical protein
MTTRTPLEEAPPSLAGGRAVLLKREDVHELGAFKWRGALPVLERYREDGAASVVTASTGNHGAAAAWAAERLGLRAIVYAPQALVNLSLGLSPLHTNYELAVYDLMYDVNWHRLGELAMPPTMFEVMLSDPGLFFTRWLRGFLGLMVYALPALGFTALARDAKARQWGLAASLFLIGYATVFGVSAGGRAPLLVLPLALIFLGGLLSRVHDALQEGASSMFTMARIATPVVLLVVLCYFAARDVRVLTVRAETDAVYRDVESFLVAEGVRDARTIFTTDFDLYFREIRPFRPRYNGGWGLFGTYRWLEEFPQAPTTGLDAFLDEARHRDWKYVILSPRAEQAASFLGDVYVGTA